MSVVRKVRCQVNCILCHGNHVYTVDLLPENQLPRFRQGQFLHLALDQYEPSGFWPESRAFSIASSPSQRNWLRISYSVVGRFTSRMEQELDEGDYVWIKLPYGDFSIDNAKDSVLYAGGTGITAFTSFLDSLRPDFPKHIYLAYGVRSEDLLIYKDLVEQRRREVQQLHVFYFVEQPLGNYIENESTADQLTGRLSVSAFWNQILNPSEAIYYISGPPPMIKTISHDLVGRGILPESIRIDAWE